MFKIIPLSVLLSFLLLGLLSPSQTFSAVDPSTTPHDTLDTNNIERDTHDPTTIAKSPAKTGDKVGLINPLKAKSISEFLVAIVDVLLIFATPLIVIYIMYAGFKFVTAQGNPSEIESARTALLWAVVGGVIVLGAKLIIEVIDGTIKAFSP